MRYPLSVLVLTALLAGCAAPKARRDGQVMPGIDVLKSRAFAELRGKRVGLIVNHTSKDSQGRSTVDLLSAAPDVTLAAIFTPEHGFAGSSEENKVSNDTLTVERRVVPIVSLYQGGIKGMRPAQADLVGLDALVFDIQDIGARFYTYLATMAMAMEEAKSAGIEFFVLDRPNPIGGDEIEGPLLDDTELRKLTSIAYFAVPVRHGMTAGEMALLHNAEVGHPRLTVIPAENWARRKWFDDTRLPWTPPSPNMPNLASATMYPGTACLEFSNLSVGRGTPEPFLWIGAPWLRAEDLAKTLNASPLEGVAFSARNYTPLKSEYAGKPCRGVHLKITNRLAAKPWRIFAHILAGLRDLHPDEYKPNWPETRKLLGTDRVQKLYERGASGAEIAREFEPDARRFAATRKPFLIYK